MSFFHWLPDHVAGIAAAPLPAAPIIAREDVPDVLPGQVLWDHWPVLTPEGALAEVAGRRLVIALVAPRAEDPDARHGVARLWLFACQQGRWSPIGPLFPDGFSPGSREWSGSAILESARLRVYFTAAGARGESAPSFTQRLFETEAALGDDLRPRAWSAPVESVAPDGHWYRRDFVGGGAIGAIKAFRDPYFVRLSSGAELLLFTASDAARPSAHDGVIGVARREGGQWRLAPPIVGAAGVNNELERPHLIAHGGALYLFWSTQAHVFAPGGPAGPTGLYGLMAPDWGAPWRPLNGTGLVLANPREAPAQAYSWQVLPDLRVWSFADRPAGGEFIGGPAPALRLSLEGAHATLVAAPAAAMVQRHGG